MTTIIGYASTKDLNTGGRNTAFLMDEFGDFPVRKDYDALETMYAGVTNSVFLVSTFNKRRGCAFNVTAKNAKFPAKRLRVSWEDCPTQAAGKYRATAEGVQFLDPTYRHVQGYEFIRDGQTRSPYFDLKSSGLTKQQIARQLLADEEGSSQQGLDQETIKRLLIGILSFKYFENKFPVPLDHCLHACYRLLRETRIREIFMLAGINIMSHRISCVGNRSWEM